MRLLCRCIMEEEEEGGGGVVSKVGGPSGRDKDKGGRQTGQRFNVTLGA